MLRLEDSLQSHLRRLRNDPGLHILLPAGIGDCLWALAKLGRVIEHRTSAGQDVTIYLPDGEQHRTGPYLDMLGLDHAYLPFETRWVWDRHGSPDIPVSGWFSCHANRHLENGHRIESWYPELQLRYPRPHYRPPVPADLNGGTYVALFPGARKYMGGNLSVEEWIRLARGIEARLRLLGGTVRLFGAGQDIEYVQAIAGQIASPKAGHLFDRPFSELLPVLASPCCLGVVGVASGPLIAASVERTPVVMAYPKHLSLMPTSWEPPYVLKEGLMRCCFVTDLPGIHLDKVIEWMQDKFIQRRDALYVSNAAITAYHLG